ADPEQEGFRVKVVTKDAEHTRETILDHAFVASPEMDELRESGGALRRDLGPAPYTLTAENGAEKTHRTLRATLEGVLEAGRKGQHIQRNTGLGEMNADELGEPTMNPETTMFTQVRREVA